jgi:uncharacterized RDD family membrane protein YckC
MYCPKCGAANADQASFCQRCGADLKVTVTPTGEVKSARPDVSRIITYAGFWKRLGAVIIDGLIVGAAVSILITVSWGVLSPVAIIAGWLYYALMESSSIQATLGKMALGIIVTDTDGKRLSFGRATGRYFGKIVSAIILYVGFIMIAFTEKKQGLHDMMANTLVVNK